MGCVRLLVCYAHAGPRYVELSDLSIRSLYDVLLGISKERFRAACAVAGSVFAR